jgi:peptidoglycan-N-acetylglucosamine deacetylase
VARHLACLTIDFDATSTWILRGMTTPTPISRGEFGAVGAERILDLLGRLGIAATWFIPGHTVQTYPELARRVHAAGHEIGHHGYLHEPPATLARPAEEEVLVRGLAAIHDVVGVMPSGYRSPSWDLSAHTVDLLAAHGFLYDTSMMAHDTQPYRARRGDVFPRDGAARFGPATPLVEMPVSWSLSDYQQFEYTQILPGLRSSGDVLENWVDDFRYMARTVDWGVLTFTVHPQAIGRGHRMLFLERLIDALADLGAAFVRMDAAAREFDKRAPYHD